ncbi:MAG: 30S ribosomal protein S18 [bacterium]|nr:30S ribosomal protein S18 [bacterium]MCX7917944.1 30S ribosomal protein S18 [bacterium]MDW8164259.1 30S ribosomal protein S18 [Candidatus Omnitrophota bacterium]
MAKKKKICKFCQENILEIDYKDIGRIRRYITPRGKIISSKQSGVCAKHQRALTKAIKRARFVGFLPFVKI